MWVLIDLEGDAARQRQAQDAKRRAEQKSVKVALSVPCYEVWTLLHLEDTGAPVRTTAADVLAQVKRLWKNAFRAACRPQGPGRLFQDHRIAQRGGDPC